MKASSVLIVAPHTSSPTGFVMPASSQKPQPVTNRDSNHHQSSNTNSGLLLGNQENGQINLSTHTVDLISGAFAGIITTFVAHPLDTVKIRF